MHGVVLDFNAMWTDSNARQWYVKAILSYGVCCKKKCMDWLYELILINITIGVFILKNIFWKKKSFSFLYFYPISAFF